MKRRTHASWVLPLSLCAAGCTASARSTSDGGPSSDPVPSTGRADTSGSPSVSAPVRAPTVAEKGLEAWFEILPDTHVDRIAMRTVVLHFKNTSKDPIRIHMPASQPFRANISTLSFSVGSNRMVVPEPRPHGYKITEADFPLLQSGEEKTFDQVFSVETMEGGPGIHRVTGFDAGVTAKVQWDYGSSVTKWEGGKDTLDGPTNELFGGKEIPYIWTGHLKTETTWIVP